MRRILPAAFDVQFVIETLFTEIALFVGHPVVESAVWLNDKLCHAGSPRHLSKAMLRHDLRDLQQAEPSPMLTPLSICDRSFVLRLGHTHENHPADTLANRHLVCAESVVSVRKPCRRSYAKDPHWCSLARAHLYAFLRCARKRVSRQSRSRSRIHPNEHWQIGR